MKTHLNRILRLSIYPCMKKFSLLLVYISLIIGGIAQQRQPVSQLSNQVLSTHAFVNCTLVPAPGIKWANGVLLVRDGIIIDAGQGIDIPDHAFVHDLNGQWVYPGFIDPGSHAGLDSVKVHSRPSTGDPQFGRTKPGPYYWNEAIQPETELIATYQWDEEHVKPFREKGFTSLNIVPNDGIFRGTGFLLNTGSGSLQEQLITGVSSGTVSFQKGSAKQEYPNSLMGAIALIRQALLDAGHYRQAQAAILQNPKQPGIETNLSLEALNEQMDSGLPLILESTSYLHTLRAAQLATEFDLEWVYHTQGEEYRRIDAFKALNARFIVPLNFPQAYDLTQIGAAHEVSLEALKHWELAPTNPAKLAEAGITFAFSLNGAPDSLDVVAAIQKARMHGLSEKDALAALTTSPAEILHVSDRIGTLEKGKIANFIAVSADLFALAGKPEISEVWVAGNSFEIETLREVSLARSYTLNISGAPATLTFTEDKAEINLRITLPESNQILIGKAELSGHQLTCWAKGGDQHYRFWGLVADNKIMGTIEDIAGQRSTFEAAPVLSSSASIQVKVDVQTSASMASITYPNGAFGFAELPVAEEVLIQGATVWTNTESGILEQADVLVQNGKIIQVGKAIRVSKKVKIINGTGMHLTPGIVDEHSHIAMQEGINEGTHSVTAEVRVEDVINPNDVEIYRQLAGGVTTSQLLHGSANPIGGQSALIKLRWGKTAEEMKVKGAPGFIKFALGENVKRSRYGRASTRYPNSRMGVEQLMQDVFRQAKEYRREWQSWEQTGKAANLIPPQKDLQLETLLEILDGKRHITCHSYVQSEITMLLRLAEQEGFRINTLTHILEGYKVADKIKEHGANVSTFSDWWAYKYEVIDAIPYNAAIMYEQGLNVCINSDDAEMARRLNQEAAKTVKYGGVPEEAALKMVTLNPAKALRIDDRVGSIEPGKDADLVLWSDHPLSVYAVAQKTFIDGVLYFDIDRDRELREATAKERNRIIQKMLQEPGAKTDPPLKESGRGHQHCLDEAGH